MTALFSRGQILEKYVIRHVISPYLWHVVRHRSYDIITYRVFLFLKSLNNLCLCSGFDALKGPTCFNRRSIQSNRGTIKSYFEGATVMDWDMSYQIEFSKPFKIETCHNFHHKFMTPKKVSYIFMTCLIFCGVWSLVIKRKHAPMGLEPTHNTSTVASQARTLPLHQLTSRSWMEFQGPNKPSTKC